MSMWNDKLIWEAIDVARLDVLPLVFVPPDRLERFGPMDASQVQPASLDVRLGEEFITHPEGSRIIPSAEGSGYQIRPGECLLASLVETVAIWDNVVARVEGKSRWARQFLTVHSAGFIDPGFQGDITLELKNDGATDLWLVPGVRIAQLSFQWLAAPAKRPYGSEGLGSHYQYQKGPTEA
jgi:dCTP deaminase